MSVAIALCGVRTIPVTSNTLLTLASDTGSLGPVPELLYSTLQQTPFERCSTISDSKAALAAALRRDDLAVWRLPGEYNRRMLRLYRAHCPKQPIFYHYYVDYQYSFAYAVPYAWMIERFGLTEIYVSLAVLLTAWAGLVALAVAGRRIAGHWIGAALTLCTFWFTCWFFQPGLMQRCATLHLAGFMAIAQCWAASGDMSSRRRVWFAFGVAAFLWLSFLTIFMVPLTNRLNPWITLAAALLPLAFRRMWRASACLLIPVALLLILRVPYDRFSTGVLRPVSTVNSAESEDYKFTNIAMYLFERPTPYGFPNGDAGYIWVYERDSLLRRASSVIGFHQGFKSWGSTYVRDVTRHYPIVFPEAWLKRFFDQVYFHRQLSFGFYGPHEWSAAVVFWAGLVLLAGAGLRTAAGSAVWPVLIVIAWQIFGVNTFLALVHTHPTYMALGIVLLWIFLPAMTLHLVLTGAGKPVPDHVSHWRARHVMIRFAVVAVILLLGAPSIAREVRKEIVAFKIWYAVHAGTVSRSAYHQPNYIRQRMSDLIGLGNNYPGAAQMYGAFAMAAYAERWSYYARFGGNVDYAADARIATNLSLAYYKAALAEAPHNPNFPAYARFIGAADWVSIFKNALARYPNHPYASMMAFELLINGGLDRSEQQKYAEAYDTSTSALLESTYDKRPGYVRIPPLARTDTGVHVVSTDAITAQIPAGRRLAFGPADAFNSDRLVFAIYAKVLDGSARLSVDADGTACASDTVDADALIHYRLLRCQLQFPAKHFALAVEAGPSGATVVLRDFYPMVENPRWFR